MSHRRRVSIHHEDCYATRSSSSSSSTRDVARARRAHGRGATQPPLPSRSPHRHRHRHHATTTRLKNWKKEWWWWKHVVEGCPLARGYASIRFLRGALVVRHHRLTIPRRVTVGQRLELQAIRDTTAVEYELHRGNRELWYSGGTEGGTKEGGSGTGRRKDRSASIG